MTLQGDLTVDRRLDVPLGAQLATGIRDALQRGELTRGERLPSVRELAAAAGVNVNTARAVYARLESEGIVTSEHGRGTFVAPPPHEAAATRRELRRQIARLESELARRPRPPTLAEGSSRSGARGAALLSAEDLAVVRDRLLAQLLDLDAQRAALVGTLAQLGVEPVEVVESRPSRRGTPSLTGARIRWTGA
jgi:DNA-binding transcriptional regulator YhcF (GntR family)